MKRYNTYAGWKRAVNDLAKKYRPLAYFFEGDKDIAQAFCMLAGVKVCMGEWEGSYGEVKIAL